MRNEGYLIINHQASPGLAPDVARSIGLDPKLVGEGRVFEAATLTCVHCQSIVIMNPDRSRQRGHCFKCNGYVCDNALCHAECRPMRKHIDQVQELAFKYDTRGNGPLVLTADGSPARNQRKD